MIFGRNLQANLIWLNKLVNGKEIIMKNNYSKKSRGLWLGLLAIALAVLGFFWLPMPLGFFAIVLGIYGLRSPYKVINWIAIVLGTIILVLGII